MYAALVALVLFLRIGFGRKIGVLAPLYVLTVEVGEQRDVFLGVVWKILNCPCRKLRQALKNGLETIMIAVSFGSQRRVTSLFSVFF